MNTGEHLWCARHWAGAGYCSTEKSLEVTNPLKQEQEVFFLEALHQEHISQISISNSLMLNRCWLHALVDKLGCWNFQQGFGLEILVI